MGISILGRGILTRPALKTERVEVPELGGTVILREMSAAQVADFVRYIGALADDDPSNNMRRAGWTVIACMVDEAGDQVLTIDDMDVLLATQSVATLNHLSTRAGVLSEMVPDAVASAEKNSESRQNEDSGTN